MDSIEVCIANKYLVLVHGNQDNEAEIKSLLVIEALTLTNNVEK